MLPDDVPFTTERLCKICGAPKLRDGRCSDLACRYCPDVVRPAKWPVWGRVGGLGSGGGSGKGRGVSETKTKADAAARREMPGRVARQITLGERPRFTLYQWPIKPQPK